MALGNVQCLPGISHVDFAFTQTMTELFPILWCNCSFNLYYAGLFKCWNTVFRRINAPGTEAENEPSALSDLNETSVTLEYPNLKWGKYHSFRSVKYGSFWNMDSQSQKSGTRLFKQGHLLGKIRYHLKCTSALTPDAHFSGYLHWWWWQNHVLTS